MLGRRKRRDEWQERRRAGPEGPGDPGAGGVDAVEFPEKRVARCEAGRDSAPPLPRRGLCPRDKEFSKETYTGRTPLQKTAGTSAVQIESNGLMGRYLYTETHEAILSDERLWRYSGRSPADPMGREI